MPEYVGVKFPKTGKFSFYPATTVEFSEGDQVIVETERGLEMGTVLIPRHACGRTDDAAGTILRKATEDDLARKAEQEPLEDEAMSYCRQRISQREMEMKLVSVDFTLDQTKAVFYFTADGRIDFRELVKDLAHRFHLRIEMRQIGVRDEAKMIGGIGVCGQELCCARFLNRFDPVSIKMAKAQNLVLNPSKISGTCGRLMCCINYECDMSANCRNHNSGSDNYQRPAETGDSETS